ncbi:hypothetical protein K435DRAFT_874107 [Dendrothele bispora CBS 962.96]|uniref:Uncharacterized protein n=1 Tax=Dendrothele bispora (strain CBS 962.96) TaxID=1314807 RepID=A0A4S8KYL8_DENBC|nr:hypothetical protein K435DRAFT_874107 [Dendrothele bispora CBS 962.96]
MSSSHATSSTTSSSVPRLINGRSRHFNDRVTAVRQCYREMMRRIKNKKTATDEERDIIESHLDFIRNFDYSVGQNSADFPPWAWEARDLCLNAAITAFPRSRDTRVRDARPHLDLRWLTLSRRKQGVWDPTVPFPSFTFENLPLYADEASAPSQTMAVAGSSTTAVSAFLRDTTPEHVDETDASSHVTEPVAPVDAGDSGTTVDPAPPSPPAVPLAPSTPPSSPQKRVRFSSPATPPAPSAGVESSGHSAAIPTPTDAPLPRLVIRIPARPRPIPEAVSGQPEASTSTAGSSAPAIQAPTPVRRSMATLGPPSSEAGPSSAVAPPRATTTTGLSRAEAVASISTIEPVNWRQGRTLVPLIAEDLRETDVQFDFDNPDLLMLTPSPPNYAPGLTSADIIKADQMTLDPRAFLQQWVRDHRHDADQTVVGRVDEYLRSFERFDIRNFSRALGDFLEDRDIDDPELDLQYPSTDTPAAPTIDATVETIMRGPTSPVTASEASAGRDESPMSVDEFPIRMSFDNSMYADDSEDNGPEPEEEVAQQPSTDVPAPADTVPESTDLEVEIPPVDSEVPAEQEASPLPGPSAQSTTVQDDEIVDESGYDWGNLSRYQRKHLESYIKYISSIALLVCIYIV